MRVLVLGGTGFIGTAVVRELIACGHAVTGLARSEVSAARLAGLGALPLAGDIAQPEPWTARLPALDAVLHAACDFDTDMGAIDRRLLDVLLPALGAQARKPRFITTGGCWLYGATGDRVATEESPFDPLPDFAWMVESLTRVLGSTAVDGIVIHPAMVHADDGGVFRRFAADARERRAVGVIASEAVRWPLVHRDDLAQLYALALERAPSGSSYIGATIDGVPVGQIARAFAKRHGTPDQTPQVISSDEIAAELGEWARGYALDQQLSGAKARRDLDWRPAHIEQIAVDDTGT